MSNPTTNPPSSPNNTSGMDPFQKLHKMSTTAGVGAHDYVAVNTPAVIAAIAGLASISAIVSPVMLVVPAFAVVCAVMAWAQIGKSNGTQTGKLLAILGVLTGLGFGGYVVAGQIREARAFAESRREIGALFTNFTTATSKGDHAAAFQVFGPSFQSRNKFPAFSAFLKMLEDNQSYGKIVGSDWNERLEAMADTMGEGNDLARAAVTLKFEKSDAKISSDVVLVRRRSDEKWVIEQMQPLFEQEQAQQRPTQGGPPPGAPQ